MINPKHLAANLRLAADVRRDCYNRYPDGKMTEAYFTAALILDSIAVALDGEGGNPPKYFVDVETGAPIA